MGSTTSRTRHRLLGVLRTPRASPLVPGCVLALTCAAPPATWAASHKWTAANWDLAAQRLVVGDGVMSDETATSFDGAGPLTAAAARSGLAALAAQQQQQQQEQQEQPQTTPTTPSAPTAQSAPVGSSASVAPSAPVAPSTPAAPAVSAPVAVSGRAPLTVVYFDALLVDQLGLGDVAAHVQQVAGAAGLDPPSYFGSEVLARYLGLRYEHPVGEQALDLYPWQQLTRAEAAHSFATVLAAGPWAVSAARETFSGFALPHYDAAQLAALRIAVSKIGMPYVWGGTTDGTADGLEHGGYDCSGFAWRVYKVSGLPWGRQILGRTAAQQAGEIPKHARLHLVDVQGGDLLFFGSAHFESQATEANVIHEGIALSSQWAIHSSDQGVYVLPLTSGWLAERFAWARRVL